LAGTISFTVAAGFQSSLTVGETFTVLNASSVTGTFSNSTIAINTSFHFTVSYTSTGVVLTVASGAAAPNSGTARPAVQVAMVRKPAAAAATTSNRRTLVVVSGQRHGISSARRPAKPIVVASWPGRTEHSNIVLAGGSEIASGLRSWERMPVGSAVQARPLVVVAPEPRGVNKDSSRGALATSDLRMGQSHAIGVQGPVTGWMGASGNRRIPVKIMQPTLPRITR